MENSKLNGSGLRNVIRDPRQVALEDKLGAFNVSPLDGNSYDFFFAKRHKMEQLEVDEKTNQLYTISGFVKPEMRNVCVKDIENAGYADDDINCLMDWYLKSFNSDKRDEEVLSSIGSDVFSIIESLQNSKNIKLFENHSGDIFGGDDGNHRLLSLLINHHIERVNAGTEKARKAIDDKYTLTLPVSYMINSKLERLLIQKQNDMREFVPEMARNYREKTIAEANQNDYMIERTHDGKFIYSFNGRKAIGSEAEIMKQIESFGEDVRPVMCWTAGDMHYASGQNMVVCSRDLKVINDWVENFERAFMDGELKLNQYLEIKDLDKQTYSVITPNYKFQGVEQKREVVDAEREILRHHSELLCKNLSGGDEAMNEHLENLLEAQDGALYDLVIVPRIYENLSKEDYNKLVDVLDIESKKILDIKQKYSTSVDELN